MTKRGLILAYGFQILAFLGSTASAAPVDSLIGGLPSTYIPGEPIEFQLQLPAITNLGAYDIDIVLESDKEMAGIDYVFNIGASIPASSGYLFSSFSNFVAALNDDSPTRHRLTLSDFDLAGIDILPGINDQIGTIVINTQGTFNGNLEISIDGSSLILDTPAITPTSVAQFQAIQSVLLAIAPSRLVAVPEPSTMAIAALLGAILWGAVGAKVKLSEKRAK